MELRETGQMITDFTKGNVTKQLIWFASPLFLSNLLQVVYNMADMIIVGQAAGKTGLSAVAVGGDVSNFLTFVSIGFSNAAQVIIAQYIGAEQRERIGKFIGMTFTFLLSCAVVLSVVCIWLREPILRLMNTPESAWDQALAYTTVCSAGLVFIYGYNIVGAILRGMGDSKHPFLFISIAAIINVILDLAFVMGLDMGAMGAALATVISQGISFLISMVFLRWKRDQFGFQIQTRDFIYLDISMLVRLVRLGVPMALKTASVQFSKLFVNSWINGYGVEVSAVAGIANKFNNISNLISSSVNTAGSSMIGQNIGAERYERVPHIMKTAFGITLTCSVLMAGALLLFPEQVFGIFTNEADSAEVLAVAMEYLPSAILIFFASAVRAPTNALINGSGNYKINFVTAVLDGLVIRIGLAMLLGLTFHLEYVGFWIGSSLASFTPFFIGMVYYLTGKWKTRRYVL